MVISTEIIQSVMIPLLVAFAISVALSPFVIPFLRRLKVGQTERVEGVQSHLKKAGTPTMGGTIILISVLVTCLFFVGRYPRIIPVLFLTLGFGIIGFLDDYLKVVLKRSDGLLPKQKLFCQLAVTTVFVVYLIFKDESGLTMVLPFTDYVLDIKWITVPLAYFAILGTDNGVNFTDGLDGLASSVTAVVAVFFTIASLALGGGIEPVTAAVAGALLGFRFSGTGRFRGRFCLYAPYALDHSGGGSDLPHRGSFRYHSGHLFQEDRRKTFLQDGAYSPSF